MDRSPWMDISEFDFRIGGDPLPDDMILDVTVVADERTTCPSCGRSNRAATTIHGMDARCFATLRGQGFPVEGRYPCNGCGKRIAFDVVGHFSAVRVADPPATGRTGEGPEPQR